MQELNDLESNPTKKATTMKKIACNTMQFFLILIVVLVILGPCAYFRHKDKTKQIQEVSCLKLENEKLLLALENKVKKQVDIRESFRQYHFNGYRVAIVEQVEGKNTIVEMISINDLFFSLQDDNFGSEICHVDRCHSSARNLSGKF